jgi:DNA-binding LacI/PurR family transcriptional regulator
VGWSRDTQGRQAGELILDRIENGGANTFRRITVPPHLIARRSSGAGT